MGHNHQQAHRHSNLLWDPLIHRKDCGLFLQNPRFYVIYTSTRDLQHELVSFLQILCLHVSDCSSCYGPSQICVHSVPTCLSFTVTAKISNKNTKIGFRFNNDAAKKELFYKIFIIISIWSALLTALDLVSTI